MSTGGTGLVGRLLDFGNPGFLLTSLFAEDDVIGIENQPFFNKHGHLVLAPATGHTTRSNRTVLPSYTMVAHGPSEVRWGRFSYLFMSIPPVPGKGVE